MMRWIGVAFLAVFLIGGCVFNRVQNGLNAMMGENIRTAFNVLGYPAGKQEFGSDIVYVWHTSRSGTYVVPQTTTYTGYVGTTPIYGSATSYESVPYHYACTIKIIAQRMPMGGPGDEIIKSWQYDGNYGGCAAFSGALARYYKSKNPQ